jgi:hypothetical protein
MPHVRINLLEQKGAIREISDPLSDDLWRGCGAYARRLAFGV